MAGRHGVGDSLDEDAFALVEGQSTLRRIGALAPATGDDVEEIDGAAQPVSACCTNVRIVEGLSELRGCCNCNVRAALPTPHKLHRQPGV